MSTLSERIQTTIAYVYDIEHGRRFPTDSRISQIACVLDVSPEEILMYDTRPPRAELAEVAHRDPMLNLAIRRLLRENVSSAEVFEFLESRRP